VCGQEILDKLYTEVDAKVQEDGHESFEEYEADRKRVRAAYLEEVATHTHTHTHTHTRTHTHTHTHVYAHTHKYYVMCVCVLARCLP
jgi:hypothetical protein